MTWFEIIIDILKIIAIIMAFVATATYGLRLRRILLNTTKKKKKKKKKSKKSSYANGYNAYHKIPDGKLPKPQKQDRGNTMEPAALLGVIGSIASIISLLQENKEAITPEIVLTTFRRNQETKGSPESKLGSVAHDADILANARMLIGIQTSNSLFLDRIQEKCLEPYQAAIADHELDDVDLEDIRGDTANCVCTNIRMVRKDNGGKFPSNEFKELWQQFECS